MNVKKAELSGPTFFMVNHVISGKDYVWSNQRVLLKELIFSVKKILQNSIVVICRNLKEKLFDNIFINKHVDI